MLSRRTFLAVSAGLSGTVLVAGTAAAREPASPAPALTGTSTSSSTGTTTLEVGPAVRHGGSTVVRVAVPTEHAALLTDAGAFRNEGGTLKGAGVRLVSQGRGTALVPQASAARRAQGSAPQGMTEAFAVFGELEGDAAFELLLPGWGLVAGIPLLSEQDAALTVTLD